MPLTDMKSSCKRLSKKPSTEEHVNPTRRPFWEEESWI